MNDKDLNKMTLRQVMEYSKNIPIKDGGLSIFFEKLVSEYEYLERMFNQMHKHITKIPKE